MLLFGGGSLKRHCKSHSQMIMITFSCRRALAVLAGAATGEVKCPAVQMSRWDACACSQTVAERRQSSLVICRQDLEEGWTVD